MDKKSIFIAIPTTKGGIVPGLVNDLLFWSHDDRYNIKVWMPEGVFPLDNARNMIVKEFLELDYNFLWWIDDDIIPPLNAMNRLASILLANGDIDALGATCFSMKNDNGEYFPYPVTLRYNDEKKYIVFYGKGVEEVDSVGGACVMVKRKVYENMERPYEFQYHKDGTLELTCDFDFWQKVQKKGFKLFVDFDILCDHQRICSIKGIQDLTNKLSVT